MTTAADARSLPPDGEVDLASADDAIWEQIVRRHQEHLFRVAYLITRDADEAADVAQEAFLRAYRARHRFDRNRAVRPWLTRIAVNLARNRRRALARYLARLPRLAAADNKLPTALSTAEQRAQAQWEAHTLWEAVQRLNRKEQDLVYLRYFLDMSEAETATTLGIPAGTAKSRLHRALQKLRRIIQADFPALIRALDEE